MFDRFTEGAIKVVLLAQDESKRLGHSFVGTEHLLLGLSGEETGFAATTLSSFGANLDVLRIGVEKLIHRGPGVVAVEIPFTPTAKSALETAFRLSQDLSLTIIDTEHLLLGVLDQPESKATQVLQILNIDLSELKGRLLMRVKQARVAGDLIRPLSTSLAQLGALAHTLKNIGKVMPDLRSEIRCIEPEPELLRDTTIRNLLHSLLEELNRIDHALMQLPSELHKEIGSVRAILQNLLEKSEETPPSET